MTGRTSRPLPEEDFARIAFQQERLRYVKAVEHLDDVAVLQHELRPARALMMTMAERLGRFHDLELRERRTLHRLRAEEAHHGAAGPQHAHDLLCQCLGGRRLEEVEEVPAEHAVDS